MQSPAGAPRGAVLLVGTLAAIYLVSQFLRNSVGVIAPDLAREIGLTAAEIGLLSSAFFFAFAAAQIPLGIALDRYGPKRCMLVCAAIAFLGTLAVRGRAPRRPASSRAHPDGARLVLLSDGAARALRQALSAGALHAARRHPDRHRHVGTLFVTAPLAWASASIGWRATFLVVAGFVVAGALLVAFVVREDAADRTEAGQARDLAREPARRARGRPHAVVRADLPDERRVAIRATC